ncbi:MAG: helix-turn-helix transcriptional regulator [Slackia sp.]
MKPQRTKRGKLHPRDLEAAPLGQLIRYYRKRAGMTQAELADEVEMSEPGIRNYELGNRTPSKAQLAAIARGLGIEPEALIAYDISSAREALGVLFQLEGTFGITPNKDGTLPSILRPMAPRRCPGFACTMPRRSLKGAR